MKTTIGLTIDIDVKKKAMDIIQNKLNSSVSREVEKYFKELIKHYEGRP